MGMISMDDVKDLKDGDLIKTKYLSFCGEIITSQVIVFRKAFLRGKNMVVINYNTRGDEKHLYEMSSIFSIKKI